MSCAADRGGKFIVTPAGVRRVITLSANAMKQGGPDGYGLVRGSDENHL